MTSALKPMETSVVSYSSGLRNLTSLARVLVVALLLYFFLVGVKSLEGAVALFGDGATHWLQFAENPLMGLMAGVMATVLVQSSSVTTSVIVGLVSAGTISLGGAVPMIMGANLGTSVTNTLVSLGHLNNKDDFKKAFAASTIHDFFNILGVIILLPLELAFGFLQTLSSWLAHALYGSLEGVKFSSPIKTMIAPAVEGIQQIDVYLAGLFNFNQTGKGIVLAIIAAVTIILSLTLIVRTMKPFVESHRGDIFNKLISQNAWAAVAFGALITIVVQSSSITTSLLVPMAGSGLLSLASIFPITVGANIGTTGTALLAALTANVAGLAIAFVHFFFNVASTLIWFAPARTRKVPIWCANKMASMVEQSKSYALIYVAFVFFIVPSGLIFLLS